MRPSFPQFAVLLTLFLAGAVAGPLLQAAGSLHSWEVRVHFRLPDGGEETLRVDDFHFVYYERRFIWKSAGFGGPRKVTVEDLPREIMSIQNEDPTRLRFSKISRITLEYRLEDGVRRLYLVAIPISPKKAPIAWPVSSLRNVSTSRFPHFRGRVEGKVMDFPLPPLEEGSGRQERILASIEFQFPGQRKHRSWL